MALVDDFDDLGSRCRFSGEATHSCGTCIGANCTEGVNACCAAPGCRAVLGALDACAAEGACYDLVHASAQGPEALSLAECVQSSCEPWCDPQKRPAPADGGVGTGGSARGGGGAGGRGGMGGQSGSAGTGGACAKEVGCEACLDCAVHGPCLSQVVACENSIDCQELLECLDTCSGSACANDCSAQHPEGNALFYEEYRCEVCAHCPTACSDIADGCPSSACDHSQDCDGCVSCAMEQACAAEVSVCVNNADCTSFADCIDPCTDQACFDDCSAEYPTGLDLYSDIVFCVVCVECYYDCDGGEAGC